MSKSRLTFSRIAKFFLYPFRLLKNKLLEKHDSVIEKRVRRQIEVTLTHELQTPLTSILGYSELLVDNLEDEGNKEDLKAAKLIHTKSKELLRLIDNVINTSVIEINPQIFFITTVNLSNIALNVLNKFKDFFEINSKWKISALIEPDITINANERLLNSIVFELLSNAYNYTQDEENPEITFILKKENRKILLIVKDNGIGISEKNLKQIFGKFYRIDDSDSTRASGLGIGLALVKKATIFFGGKIDGRSTYGVGTEITLQFPIHSPMTKEETE